MTADGDEFNHFAEPPLHLHRPTGLLFDDTGAVVNPERDDFQRKHPSVLAQVETLCNASYWETRQNNWKCNTSVINATTQLMKRYGRVSVRVKLCAVCRKFACSDMESMEKHIAAVPKCREQDELMALYCRAFPYYGETDFFFLVLSSLQPPHMPVLPITDSLINLLPDVALHVPTGITVNTEARAVVNPNTDAFFQRSMSAFVEALKFANEVYFTKDPTSLNTILIQDFKSLSSLITHEDFYICATCCMFSFKNMAEFHLHTAAHPSCKKTGDKETSYFPCQGLVCNGEYHFFFPFEKSVERLAWRADVSQWKPINKVSSVPQQNNEPHSALIENRHTIIDTNTSQPVEAEELNASGRESSNGDMPEDHGEAGHSDVNRDLDQSGPGDNGNDGEGHNQDGGDEDNDKHHPHQRKEAEKDNDSDEDFEDVEERDEEVPARDEVDEEVQHSDPITATICEISKEKLHASAASQMVRHDSAVEGGPSLDMSSVGQQSAEYDHDASMIDLDQDQYRLHAHAVKKTTESAVTSSTHPLGVQGTTSSSPHSMVLLSSDNELPDAQPTADAGSRSNGSPDVEANDNTSQGDGKETDATNDSDLSTFVKPTKQVQPLYMHRKADFSTTRHPPIRSVRKAPPIPTSRWVISLLTQEMKHELSSFRVDPAPDWNDAYANEVDRVLDNTSARMLIYFTLRMVVENIEARLESSARHMKFVIDSNRLTIYNVAKSFSLALSVTCDYENTWCVVLDVPDVTGTERQLGRGISFEGCCRICVTYSTLVAVALKSVTSFGCGLRPALLQRVLLQCLESGKISSEISMKHFKTHVMKSLFKRGH